jgi:hypothetical protein
VSGVEWPLAGVDCPWFGSDLGGWLVGRRRVMDGAEAVWLAGLAAFDREGGWAVDGQLSCAAWLMWRAGMGRATAFERVRVARELEVRPVLAEALAEGRVSYCAVRAMLRAVGASAGVDRALVAVAEAGSVADVELAVRSFRLHADQERRPEDRVASRGVRVRRLGEGMVRVEAVLTEVEGAELEAVLRAMLERETATADDTGGGDGPAGDESARADGPADPAEEADPADPVPGEPAGAGGDGTFWAGERWGGEPGDESARADCPADPDSDRTEDGQPVDESARADCPADPGDRGHDTTRGGEPENESARADWPGATESPGDTAAPAGPVVDDPVGPDRQQRSWPEMRADALMTTVRSALGSLPAAGADRYTVHVVIEHDRACLLGTGPLPDHHWQQIACDCGTVTHHHDPDGRPLTLGRKQRTWTIAQRRAITVRDNGHCRWPGCTNTHVDIHHLRPWSHGGTTDTTNGILLCPGHHTRIHQGFAATGQADGRLDFTRPDGTPLGTTTTHPATPRLPLAA